MIGNKIATARKKVNISQAQLAQRLFISAQAVGKWERGESMPDIATLSSLAEILGTDLNYFSETFHSAAPEAAAPASLPEPPVATSPTQPEKKRSWDMSSGNWVDADFSGLKNLHEKFSGSNMQRCKFIGSDLSGLLLKGNHIDSCDFSASDLSGAKLQKSHIVGNLFRDSSLKATEFSGSHLKGCDFSNADFTGAKFDSSSFQKNTVTGSVWNQTSFHGTDLSDIVIDGTVEDCYFDNCAFTRVTFQNATLLNTFFKSRTLKGMQFINCQADRLTFEFLKNGKADVSGITLITQ